jgi:hypothetical protein
MKITQGHFSGQTATISTGFFGNSPRVDVCGSRYNLGRGEISVRLVNKERRKSKTVVFAALFFVLFCLFLFGPFGLLSLPVFMLRNREAVTVQIKTPRGDSVGVADEKEWAILSRFLSA